MSELIYKVPTGTKDSIAKEEFLRQKVIQTCEKVFRIFDAQRIDTPVFELKNILLSKSNGSNSSNSALEVVSPTPNETEKQIYSLVNENEDGEQYALRYDLTVPWSRFIRTNGITKFRRYQIGKVYRRDQPNMKERRYREFYQCDFDILGKSIDSDVADAECICALITILDELKLTKRYVIKINSRKILEDIFQFCGIPSDLFAPVCSSIDKLDKQNWKYVSKELVEKGLSVEVVSKLQSVLTSCSGITFAKVHELPFLEKNTVKSLQRFIHYQGVFQYQELPVGGVLKLDFTLARGLNYYTGIIFEVTLDKTSIGSIAGGGRYDSLCNDIPCVGFSLGIDRLIIAVPNAPKSESMPQVWFVSPDTSTATSAGLPVTEELPVTVELPVTESTTELQVTTELDQTKSLRKQEKLNLSVDKINEDIFKYRIGVMQCFRRAGIRAGTELRQDLGLGAQLNYAIKNEIPYIAFIGQAEMHSGTVTMKNTTTRTQSVMTIEEAISMIQ